MRSTSCLAPSPANHRFMQMCSGTFRKLWCFSIEIFPATLASGVCCKLGDQGEKEAINFSVKCIYK